MVINIALRLLTGNATYIKDLNAYHDNFEVQSKAYRSPEVLLGDDTFDEKIDVWSVRVRAIRVIRQWAF